MFMNTKPQLLIQLAATGLIAFSLSLNADEGTAPTVSPSSEQKVHYKSGSETISFQASGGVEKAADDAQAPCPPWVKDGGSEWEWSVSGGIESDGSTTTDALKIKRSTPGKGAVKVRFKQKWKDSPPSGTATTPTDTYTPWSTPVDIMIIKVEFNGMGNTGFPSYFDGNKFGSINAWAGSVKVTPQEATSLVNVKFVQWKNTSLSYVKTDLSSHSVNPGPGEDAGYSPGTPTTSGDIINIAGGDGPGPTGFNWPEIQTMNANFNFNVYMRYSIDEAGVPFTTVGKMSWSWTGHLGRVSQINIPPLQFETTGGSTSGSGSASTESPQAP